MLAVQSVSVFTCMCACVPYVCVWQPGSLWPHHRGVSQPQPVQTCTLSCQPQCTFSVAHTLIGSRYPVENGKAPDLTNLLEYCQYAHISGFASRKMSKSCFCSQHYSHIEKVMQLGSHLISAVVM